MKFLVAISSFFLFVKITSSTENGLTETPQLNVDISGTDSSKVGGNPAITASVKEKNCFPRMRILPPLPPYEYLMSLSARADEIRNMAKEQFDAAFEEAKLLEDEIKDEAKKLLQEANTEQSKAKQIAEQKYKEVLEAAEKSKKSDKTERNKSTEDKEAQSKAETEQKKVYDAILKKCQRKRSLARAKLRKAKIEFKKAIDKANQKVTDSMVEANRIDSYVNYFLPFYQG